MEIGIIGLGRMGGNMARRLLRGGHRIVAQNRSWGPVEEIVQEGAVGARTPEKWSEIEGAARRLALLPAGKVTDDMIEKLAPLLSRGDTYRRWQRQLQDTLRRGQALAGEESLCRCRYQRRHRRVWPRV
jgi:6-phosphogluconate dehydrogenase